MGLLGHNYFPPQNKSHTSYNRGKSLHRVMSAIIENEPSVIYLCPTKGVNINLLPLLIINNITFRIVIPSKHFFSNLNGDEKKILDAASAVADKVIILSDQECEVLRWAEDWYHATQRVIGNSDWVLIARNGDEDTESFDDLVCRFKNNTKPVLAVELGMEE